MIEATSEKFSDREYILAQLSELKPALAARSSIPAFSHFWFDKRNVYSFNGGMGMKKGFPTEFAGGIPGGLLLDLLSSASSPGVEFLYEEEKENQITIKLGRSVTRLATLSIDASPWPYPDSVEGSSPEFVLSDDFVSSLKKLLLVRHDKPSRPEHYGITAYYKDDVLTLYSTDSRVAMRVDIPGFTGDIPPIVVLPREFVGQIIQSKGTAELIVASDHLRLDARGKGEGLLVCCNMLDTSDIPDMPGVVEKLWNDLPDHIPIPEGFGEAIDRVRIVAGDETPAFQLGISDGHLTVDGRSKRGRVSESFPLNGSHGLRGSIDMTTNQLLPILGEVSTITFNEECAGFTGSGGLSVVAARRD
jgi:hypothetical protein